MCWGGNFKDCASVIIVSLALLKEFGATISYEGEEPATLESLTNALQECFQEIAKES